MKMLNPSFVAHRSNTCRTQGGAGRKLCHRLPNEMILPVPGRTKAVTLSAARVSTITIMRRALSSPKVSG